MTPDTRIGWLTPAEVAERARRTTRTVYGALESGELHGHQRQRGGKWSVASEAVDAWIKGLDGAAACGCQRLRIARSA